MRTMLDIDNERVDVRPGNRRQGKEDRRKILSEFTRCGLLSGDATPSTPKSGESYVVKHGVPILPIRKP